MTTAPGTEPAAGPRAWIGLVVLSLPALLASLELTVTHLALPAIGASLGAASTQLLWIVDVYAFMLAGSLITMGTLGDRIGRRRLLLFGAAGYGTASVLAAYAPNAETLIAARALMGVAGSTLMPTTLSLAAAMFPDPRQRRVAIGTIIASVSGGTALGPLVGGWLLERYWWGSAFLLAVPVMAALLVVAPALLPEHRDAVARRLDVTSALLSLAAILPLVYGLKRIAADGVRLTAVLAVAAGLAIAVVFVRRQRGLAHPFVDLRLFADRAFSVAVGTLALGIFVLWGSNYAIAQYLQLVHDLSPLRAGLWTAPSAVGVIIGSVLAPRVVHRIHPAPVIGTGMAVSAVGYLILATIGTSGGLAILLCGSVLVSAGLGPMMALATDMVVGSAPRERAGAAAAISSAAPQLGGALGVAVLGSVITAVYRDRTAEFAPAAAPEAVLDAYRDNLGAAAVAAGRLPDPLGAELLDAARAAYTQGFHVTAVTSAILMAGAAGVLMTMLRNAPTDAAAGSRPTVGRR